MQYWEFTPQTAGTMAQIITVLLLVTIFDPTYRAQLAKRTIIDRDGEAHTVFTEKYTPIRLAARYRLFMLTMAVIVVIADSLYMMLTTPLTGIALFVAVLLNTMAVAVTGTSIVTALFQFVYGNKNEENERP